MIEQELREIASHISQLRRQEHMFIEELRVLKDRAGPELSLRLAAVNARIDPYTRVRFACQLASYHENREGRRVTGPAAD